MMKNPKIANRIAAPTLAAAVAAATLMFAGTAHAEYRCDAPSANLDKRVCALAQQGPGELRHFIERTRMIYGLYFFDYVSGADRERSAAAPDAGPPRPHGLTLTPLIASAERKRR